jgi:hypothetical protein
VATGSYGVYLWRTRGFKGFFSLAAIPFFGLSLLRRGSMEVVSYIRENQYYIQRKNMVKDFTERYGESYLLKILNPAFRL